MKDLGRLTEIKQANQNAFSAIAEIDTRLNNEMIRSQVQFLLRAYALIAQMVRAYQGCLTHTKVRDRTAHKGSWLKFEGASYSRLKAIGSRVKDGVIASEILNYSYVLLVLTLSCLGFLLGRPLFSKGDL